jgi:putative acetyltransferase
VGRNRVTEIRDERPSDAPSIHAVNTRAFGRDREANIVDALRSNNAVSLSLVAIREGKLIGHVMYSPVSVGEATGAGLAPLAVLPEHQRCGIGSDLVRVGKRRLEATGCRFIVVLGHPSFYLRFGFSPAGTYGISCQWNAPDDAFMVAMLSEPAADLKGVAKYRPEFSTVL